MFALTLILLAAPPVELKIAAPGLATTGIDSSLSAPLTDQLMAAFAPIGVITPRDVTALIGLDRQKELLGCSGAGQCLIELGSALGVQGVLLGDIIKLGGAIQINARVIEPMQGRALAQAAERVASEEQLFDALTRVGLSLRAQFYASMRVTNPPPPAVKVITPAVVAAADSGKSSPMLRPVGIVSLILGGAGAIGGGVFLGLSESSYQRLTGGQPGSVSVSDAMPIAQTGKTFQTAGAVMLGVGLGLLAVGLVLFLLGGN